MGILQYSIRKLVSGIPLVLGVTLLSFTLMVYFGPDKTYDLLGKNPTQEQIDEVRTALGYDKPFVVRYTEYLRELVTLDFGNSDSTGERVSALLQRTIPISLALSLPGFVLGNLLGVVFALFAAYFRSTWIDKAIMGFAVVGMSISFLIVIIGFQIIFLRPMGWICFRSGAGRSSLSRITWPMSPYRHSRLFSSRSDITPGSTVRLSSRK